MTNAATYKHNFARVNRISARRVELDFDLNHQRWPWLCLPPAHPILVEKYQYFGATTASWALELFSPESFTALTGFQWQCLPAAFAGGYATRGVFEQSSDRDDLDFALTLVDQQDEPVIRTSGSGFVFHDRDYPVWRERSRRLALAGEVEAPMQTAAPELLGLAPGGHSFVGAGRHGLQLTARVPSRGGFIPEHPFHTGSRDHVNAAQLLDCALQAAHRFVGQGRAWEKPLVCTGGAARFERYIELDVAFEIRREDAEADKGVHLVLSQAGRENATISLQFQS